MILFWVICAGMMLVAMLFVFPPLLNGDQIDHEAEVKEANLAVYRDQLRELDADLRNGIMSKAQHDQDREEIERRLLLDVGVDSKKKGVVKAGASSRTVVYALTIALPVVAVLLYLKVGSRNALSANRAAAVSARNATSAAPQRSQQQIEANVAALEKKLEQNPNDGAGWSMLARSYSTMGRYKEASDAFEKATAIVTNDPDLFTEYAYALSMARGQDMEGKPVELLNKAIQIDPQNLKALVLLGNAEFKAKRYDKAVEYWGKVLPTLPDKSEVQQSLSEKISEAKRLAKTSSTK